MTARGVSAVLFDLDDTLCRYTRSREAVLEAAFESAGVEPFFTVADFERWIPKVTAESALDLREQCFAAIAEECDRDPDLGYRVAAAYEDRDPENVEFLPDAEAVLDALDEQYALGLVTNGAPDHQRAKLDALGIADYFDAVAFGTPERGVKPDTAPFERVLDDLGIVAEEAVHVGDSLSADVAGAQAVGAEAVWLRTEDAALGDHDPEYVVDRLGTLRSPPWERESSRV